MIRVEDLHMHFGGIRAVDGASIEIAKGSITGLIGPNGAGKTTLFNVIAGRLPPTIGRVTDWTARTSPACRRTTCSTRGCCAPSRSRTSSRTLTVRENLMMVPAGPARRDALGRLVRARRGSRPRGAEVRAKADEVIDFLEISHVADENAGNLSGGQKKLLELGRTMMVDAKIVFLDEVGAGREPHAAQHHRRRDHPAQQGARLHLLHGRARHGLHRPALRPGHRDGRGQGAGRRARRPR